MCFLTFKDNFDVIKVVSHKSDRKPVQILNKQIPKLSINLVRTNSKIVAMKMNKNSRQIHKLGSNKNKYKIQELC